MVVKTTTTRTRSNTGPFGRLFGSIIMVILGIASITEVVMICNLAHTLAPDALSKSSVYFMAIASFFHVLAMCSGFLYLSKGYGKAQAGYYKAFILFVALSLAVSMLSNLLSIFSGTEAMACLSSCPYPDPATPGDTTPNLPYYNYDSNIC